VDVAGFLTVRFHDNERAWLYLRDLPDLLGNGEAAPFLHKNTQCDDPTPRLMNSLTTQLLHLDLTNFELVGVSWWGSSTSLRYEDRFH